MPEKDRWKEKAIFLTSPCALSFLTNQCYQIQPSFILLLLFFYGCNTSGLPTAFFSYLGVGFFLTGYIPKHQFFVAYFSNPSVLSGPRLNKPKVLLQGLKQPENTC